MLILVLALAAANLPPPDPAVAQALRSPVDLYGIPTELYPLDSQLLGLRTSIEARSKSRRQTGAGLIGAGVVGMAVAGVLAAVAAGNAAEAHDSGKIVIYDPSSTQYTVAALGAIISAVSLGYGIKLLFSKPDPSYLQRYYQTVYRP